MHGKYLVSALDRVSKLCLTALLNARLSASGELWKIAIFKILATQPSG